MKVSHAIVTRIEGTLDQLIELENAATQHVPTLPEVLAVIRNLSFIVEVTPELKANATAQRATGEASAILAAFGG